MAQTAAALATGSSVRWRASEEEHEVVLHEETPVVEKRTVPKERVRLDTDTVTDEKSVYEDVRKERIEVEDPEHARQ